MIVRAGVSAGQRSAALKALLFTSIMLLMWNDHEGAVFAFAPPSLTTLPTATRQQRTSTRLLASSSSLRDKSSSSSTEDMKKDIDAMRQEALARLEALNVEMEEVLLESSNEHHQNNKNQKKAAETTTMLNKASAPEQAKSAATTTRQVSKGQDASTKTKEAKKDSSRVSDSNNIEQQEEALLQQHQEMLDLNQPPPLMANKQAANLDLLDDTRWKIMFNVGREPGTWMPKSWGASGDRLRFYAVVDFTGQPASRQGGESGGSSNISNNNMRDDFFEDASPSSSSSSVAMSSDSSSSSSKASRGSNKDSKEADDKGVDLSGENGENVSGGGGGTKELRVVEAWLGPTYYAQDYHGRKALNVSPVGAYKVVRGAGPLGTDVLRFYMELREPIAGSDRRDGSPSDVSCPAGRIYGNCGYFPVHAASERDPAQLERNKYKERLQTEHRETAIKLETLQREADNDEHGMFSWDALKRMKESMNLRRRLEKLEARMLEARQRDPDRSTLRLSSKGNVGVTREGGVCCKVQKGITVEYHILGRMELGPVEKVKNPEDHEDYEDLVRKQVHP